MAFETLRLHGEMSSHTEELAGASLAVLGARSVLGGESRNSTERGKGGCSEQEIPDLQAYNQEPHSQRLETASLPARSREKRQSGILLKGDEQERGRMC